MQRSRPVGLRLIYVGALGDEFHRSAAVSGLNPIRERLGLSAASQHKPHDGGGGGGPTHL
jgi:hypothetical protein